MKLKISKPLSDYLGIASSALCMIHCIVTPIWLTAHTAYAAAGHHHHVEFASVDYIFIAVSFIAVIFSSRQTSSSTVKMLLWAFFLTFLSLLIASRYIHWLEFVAYGASAGLILTHFYNIRFCRTATCQA